MGTLIGEWVEYRCLDDCRQEGCPGHKVRKNFQRSTDIIIFEFENKSTNEITNLYFDSNQLAAIHKAEQLFKDKYKCA